MIRMIRRTVALILAWSFLVGAASVGRSDPEVERTRRQVRMLDEPYQALMALTNEHKVKNVASTVEIRAADLSGSPINPSSRPGDRFETGAARRIIQGDEWYEEIVVTDGKRSLRVATPVMFSTRGCPACHSEYRGFPEGQPIGFLSYRLPVE